MTLIEHLEAVKDEATFLAFVRALIQDREAEAGRKIDNFGRGVNGWENHSIEAFLDAALSWAEATNIGETQGLSNGSPWKQFAVFLYCGKIYE